MTQGAPLLPPSPFRDASRPSDDSVSALTGPELVRYSRHILLPEVGREGQLRLKNGRVLLVGAGALGSPLAQYLAAAGVGCIGLVDRDRVEESNLQRQVIYRVADVGRRKTEAARDGILRLNPQVRVVLHDACLSSANALDIFRDYDVVADASDNFPTRYLVNDACALLGKPDVFGSVYRFQGQAAVFHAKRGACLRCFFPTPPPPDQTPSCGEGGVLGVLPGLVGCIQATETLKLLLDAGDALTDRFLTVDAWRMRFHAFPLRKQAQCPLCGERPAIHELIDYQEFCGTRPSGEEETPAEGVSPAELRALLAGGADIQLIDVRLPEEQAISRLPQARSIPLVRLLHHPELLDPARDAVLFCKEGIKSETAIFGLREAGYQGRLLHLLGGLNAWAEDVDPSMTRY